MQSLHKVNLAEYGLSMITFKYKLYILNDRLLQCEASSQNRILLILYFYIYFHLLTIITNKNTMHNHHYTWYLILNFYLSP